MLCPDHQSHAKDKKLERKLRQLDLVAIDDDDAQFLLQDLDSIEEAFPDTFADTMSAHPAIASTWQENMQALHDGVRGKGKGIRYSPAVIRIALSIFVRSPSTLGVLREFNVLPIPSDRTLKRYLSTYRHGPGIADQKLHYLMTDGRNRFKVFIVTIRTCNQFNLIIKGSLDDIFFAGC